MKSRVTFDHRNQEGWRDGPDPSGGTEVSPADRGAKPQSRLLNLEDPSEGQAEGPNGGGSAVVPFAQRQTQTSGLRVRIQGRAVSTWLRTVPSRTQRGVTVNKAHQPDHTFSLAGLELSRLGVGVDIVYLAPSGAQNEAGSAVGMSSKEGCLMGQRQSGRGPEGPQALGERHRANTQRDMWLSCHTCVQGIQLQKGRMSFQGYVA